MKRKRPTTTSGYTIKKRVGCGTIYVTINSDDISPIEVFITLGKAGGCIGTLLGVIAKMISLALRSDAEIEEVLRYIEEIPCPKTAPGAIGCPEAIAYSIKKYLALPKTTEDNNG